MDEFCYAVYMLSWDRVSSLWFWLSNCLVLKVIYLLYRHSVGFVRQLYHCTYSQLRNTLWAWTYHRSREYQEETYSLSFNCTKSSFLRAFHFKFLHGQLATKPFLLNCRIPTTDCCTPCKKIPKP